MTLANDRTVTRRRLAHPIAAGLLAVLALVACGDRDRLEAIRQLQASGDYEGSIEPLRELLVERPDDPEANYLYGRALVVTQRSTVATFPLRKAMEDPEWMVRAGLQLASASLATADYNEVVEVLARVLERDPENTQALLLRANAHAHWRKDPEQALADANRVLELDPDAVEAFDPRILALLWLGRIDEAREAIAELGRRMDEVAAPESTRAWLCATSAIFAEESGELARAREAWKQCLETHPAEAEVVRPAVAFYDEHKEPSRAVEVLRVAVEKSPTTQSYRAALADRLRTTGAADEGEAVLREGTRTQDRQLAVSAWLDLARFHHKREQAAPAAEAMARAVELAKETGLVTPQLMFEYADTLVLAKQFDRAKQLAAELTVPAHRHLILARAAQEQGDPARALEEFDKGFLLWPNNPWARYYAARAAEDVGDFDRAVEDYRTSIRIDPGATDARTRAAQLLIAEGKPRFGIQLLRELDHHPLELPGELLSLHTTGRHSPREEVTQQLVYFAGRFPESIGLGMAAAAEGFAEGESGPAGAVELLRKMPGVDLTNPRHAAALRALVRHVHAADGATPPAELRAALAAHAESGAIQEIHGLDRELAGAGDAARAAYQRALELSPESPGALAGLARLTVESDLEKALALFDRAFTADPSDPAPPLAAARALVSAGRPDEAAARLDALLKEHPADVEAAALRASLDLDRGVATPRTVERARRAVRFGGGVEALDLLGRVYTQRGEIELAAQAAERAKALRERRSAEAG
jgi:tetratricopeptide (TPR) repeat protein